MQWKFNKKEYSRGCTVSPKFQFLKREFENVKCRNRELMTVIP